MRLLSAVTRPGNDLNKCLERYLGIKPADDLTFDEWRQFSPRHGRAAAFCTASIIARSSSPLSRTI